MDADVDHVDSYFARVPRHPPSSLAMHPIHTDTQKDKVAGVAPPSSLSFVSHVPISPFHVRHPHLNRSTFARSPTNQMNDSHIIEPALLVMKMSRTTTGVAASQSSVRSLSSAYILFRLQISRLLRRLSCLQERQVSRVPLRLED